MAAASISFTTCALVLRLSGQSSRGFMITKVSATLGGMGSVATSAVPNLVKTCATSGNSLKRDSSNVCISTA